MARLVCLGYFASVVIVTADGFEGSCARTTTFRVSDEELESRLRKRLGFSDTHLMELSAFAVILASAPNYIGVFVLGFLFLNFWVNF